MSNNLFANPKSLKGFERKIRVHLFQHTRTCVCDTTNGRKKSERSLCEKACMREIVVDRAMNSKGASIFYTYARRIKAFVIINAGVKEMYSAS